LYFTVLPFFLNCKNHIYGTRSRGSIEGGYAVKIPNSKKHKKRTDCAETDWLLNEEGENRIIFRLLNNFIIGMSPDLEKGIVREANLLKKFYKEREKITLAVTDPIVIILKPNDRNITVYV
jgi:hypothetical protein